MPSIVDYTFNLAKVTIFLVRKARAAMSVSTNIIPKTVFNKKDNLTARGVMQRSSAMKKTLYAIASVLSNFRFLKIIAKPNREKKAKNNLSVIRQKITRTVFISFISTS